MPSIRKPGADLKVGDNIRVWWRPYVDRIITLEPHRGPIAHIFKGGASIAGFAVGPAMTIDHGALFDVVE